jgi:hypothetical protein
MIHGQTAATPVTSQETGAADKWVQREAARAEGGAAIVELPVPRVATAQPSVTDRTTALALPAPIREHEHRG